MTWRQNWSADKSEWRRLTTECIGPPYWLNDYCTSSQWQVLTRSGRFSNGGVMARIWQRVPAAIRGPILGIVVLLVGVQPIIILVSLNLEVFNFVPWSVIPGVLYLWIFWSYLNGKGPPRSTSDRRRELLRANTLSPESRLLVLLASLSLGVLIATSALMAHAAREVTMEELGPVHEVLLSSPVTAMGLIFLVELFSGVIEKVRVQSQVQPSHETLWLYALRSRPLLAGTSPCVVLSYTDWY
jgi:hypothetical protein